MNVQVLIEGIVRQTTVLIAQLATSGGARTPLADVADQVFRELSQELHNQGVSRKVAADMFGMALRSYRRRVRRLSESSTVRGRSLWEAVLQHVRAASPVSRGEILAAFAADDEELVRGVLQDLVESGLVAAGGRGATTTYLSVDYEAAGMGSRPPGDLEGFDTLIWGAIYRRGPIHMEELRREVPADDGLVDAAVDRLVESGRVRRTEDEKRGTLLRAGGFVIPFGSSSGWEAAFLDHFHAPVAMMCNKLRAGNVPPEGDATIGGSTYSIEVWSEHPLEAEVLTELSRLRERLGDLRHRVVTHNASTSVPERRKRVVIYCGQYVIDDEEDTEHDD